MQSKQENITPTLIKVNFIAEENELSSAKSAAIKTLGANVKVQGFRAGKAPVDLIEKNIDPQILQAEVLEKVVNVLYVSYVEDKVIRPVSQPEITVNKYVPFTTLEFTAEVEVVGKIDLGNYKKVRVTKPSYTVSADDINAVLKDLSLRSAERQEVTRPAKNGDELTIDFLGVDAKTKEPINGADGKGYPLILGSNTFIPGFEPELIGLKPSEVKTFDIVFPEDYSVSALKKKKVTFTVTVHKLQEIKPIKIDDAFAAKVSPFEKLADLKADIKGQLTQEKEQQSKRALENELLEKIAAGAKVDIPELLLEEEMTRLEDEEKQNIVYRGQTWQEHLDEEGVTAEEHHERQRPNAELRVKVGLVLGAIAEAEGVTVTAEEVDMRIQLLKGQYTNPEMQAELDKPENRRDITSRLVSEKTIQILVDQATK